MNLSTLISQRNALVRQAHLANVAYCYSSVRLLAHRLQAANLRGLVYLKRTQSIEGDYSESLTALEGSQSLIEEHFAEADITDLLDTVAFIQGEPLVNLCFRLDELSDRFITPLCEVLERSGVQMDANEDIVRQQDSFTSERESG